MQESIGGAYKDSFEFWQNESYFVSDYLRDVQNCGKIENAKEQKGKMILENKKEKMGASGACCVPVLYR